MMLINVWQKYIQNWHDDQQRYKNLEQTGQSNDATPMRDDNGHTLAPRRGNEGVYCVKCGKYVSRMKHIRLKITSRPCQMKDLPRDKWLQQEGASRNEARYDQLETELQEKYNKGGHTLSWNRCIGKTIGAEDEGIVKCLACKRQWRWKDRMVGLASSKCNPPQPEPDAMPARPRVRIRTKSNPSHSAVHSQQQSFHSDVIDNSDVVSHTNPAGSASSSSTRWRVGVG
jgi:hypothetical protein